MSKSVLVIDTPGNCYSCCLHEPIRNWSYCAVKLKRIENSSVKPDWCPLMDLPEKDNGNHPANTSDAGFVEGWNQCIDAITGGNYDD